MKILIIEDENPAAEKLRRFITRHDTSHEVVQVCDSIESATAYLQNEQDFDLVFMDIQLKDGKSFEIIKQVSISRPVIFTTAYDEYALEAFKLNSIAYLLKPYTYEEFENALKKLDRIKNEFKPELNLQNLSAVITQIGRKAYKERFMVKLGDHLKSINTRDIAYFFADGRTVYLITRENRRFIVDFNLEELERLLDPTEFFRANRSFIVQIESITDAASYANSRLLITVEPTINKEIIISRDRVNAFKDWFSGQ